MRLIITSLVAGLALAAGGSAGSNARESVSNVTGVSRFKSGYRVWEVVR